MKAPFPIHQEADGLPRRWLLGVAGGALLALLAAVGASTRIGHTADVSRMASPPRLPNRVTALEQSLIEDSERGLDLQRRQRAELDRYGWVDRDAGIAHIPIERAMQLSVERSK
ncbi:MAG TPA: hypothetical protein VGL19_09685 [Polyangiaceae bacterium]